MLAAGGTTFYLTGMTKRGSSEWSKWGALMPNKSIDTDAQGRPRLRRSCSLVAGHLRR
jgi:hypothetical protein